MDKNNYDIVTHVRYIVGGIGMCMSISLMPPIFSRYFAMSFLLKGEILALWGFFGIVFIVSFCIIVTKLKIKTEMILLFSGMLSVISIEMTIRVFISYVRPWEKAQYAYLANKTYPEFMAYTGHPFLHFTGNPSVSLIGNRSIGNLTPFNNFGFIGKDFTYKKDQNVIRVAALGGSTTADGYPKILEDYLNTNKDNISYMFEVMNFGLPSYTSTHCLVNFVLNIVDFSPDYVIFHEAWNDSWVRNAVNFRNDYSHAFQYFHEPEILDKYPLRISVFYRFLKKTFMRVPADWEDLGNAIGKGKSKIFTTTNDNMMNLDELQPYKRNIITIIQLSNLRGINVLLTTQPHSTDSTALFYSNLIVKHMEQCNTIMRQIHHDYRNVTLFVDLDEQMTEKMNTVFIDFGHMNHEGITYKAEQIGKAILAHVTTNESLH